MKMIILIGLFFSLFTVAPKSIQQKAAGNAEQRARQLDEGPATLESWDENGEEQVLKVKKMLQIRQAVQEADSELIQAEREAADPQADTGRQDWWPFGGSDEENSDEENLDEENSVSDFQNTAKGLKKCLKAAGKDVMKSGIKWMKEQLNAKYGQRVSGKGLSGFVDLLFGPRDQEIEQSQAKGNEQEAFKKAMEELIQAEREAADPQTNLRQQDILDTIKSVFGCGKNWVQEKFGLGLKRSKGEEVPEEEVPEEVAEE